MHGGTVSVESAGTGFGSKFITTLPLTGNQQAGQGKSRNKTTSVERCRILLIEDNANANRTMKDLLELEGHAVTSVGDGTVGRATAAKNVFEVMICDIGLPGIGGLEVVKQLRRQSPQSMPYAIAISGYGQPKNQALQAVSTNIWSNR